MGRFVTAVLAIVLSFGLVVPSAMAGDVNNGAAIFTQNCAACHAGGKNAVVKKKKLTQKALEKYDMYSLEKIQYQVTNGKGAMPKFGTKLSAEQIEDVATYVLAQADAGWQ